MKNIFREQWLAQFHDQSVLRERIRPLSRFFERHYICCDSDLDVERALTFWQAMGADVTGVEESYLRDTPSSPGRPYMGVIDGVLSCYSSEDVISARDYKILPITDYTLRSRMRDLITRTVAVQCETPEIAMLVLKVADELGFRWSSGDRYTHTNYFTADLLDTGICYAISDGTWGTNDRVEREGYTIISAQKLLFDIDNPLVERESINVESLVRNRIYVSYRPYPGSYDSTSSRVVFKYSGELRGTHKMRNSYASILNVEDGIYGYPIFNATLQEKNDFAAELIEIEARGRERSIAERSYYMNTRGELLKEKKQMELENYNRDLPTQLLSSSLHKMLLKRTDSRVAMTLLKLNKLGYFKGVIRNVTISRSTQEMTYTPNNKECEIGEKGGWALKNRQSSKYGKLIRKILAEQVPRFKYKDEEIEYLVNHLKAEADNGDFQIVSGGDIQYWYCGSKYASDEETGTLGCSCMRGNTEFMELYAKNPEVCKMIILVKNDRLYGRALLWLDKYVDRIYGTDSTIRAFKNFAVSKGYHTKSQQNSGNIDEWINPDTGEEYTESFKIPLKNTALEYFPYADTFFFFNEEGGFISNTDRFGHTGELRDTSGSYEGSGMVWDDYDERNIHEDDSVYMEYRSQHTHIDNTMYCEIENEYFLRDDMVRLQDGTYVYENADGVIYVDSADEYALEEDTYVCDFDDRRYLESNEASVYLDEIEMTVAKSNVWLAYKQENYHYHNGEWVLIEEGAETLKNR